MWEEKIKVNVLKSFKSSLCCYNAPLKQLFLLEVQEFIEMYALLGQRGSLITDYSFKAPKRKGGLYKQTNLNIKNW